MVVPLVLPDVCRPCLLFLDCLSVLYTYSHRFWYQPVGQYTVRSTDRLAMRAFFALWIFT